MDRRELINDPETAIRTALDGRQAMTWTAFPGIVNSVNLGAMTVNVQPAIMGKQTAHDDSVTDVKLPLLLDVPIVFPSAGGFSLTLPIVKGDEVLVCIASRCIDAWWQSGGVQVAIESRMHDLSDGFAIPGPRSQPRKLSGISSTTAQLRTDSGTSYIELTPSGGINLVAAAGVSISGPLTISGDVVANGKSLDLHVHGGVQSGSGTSGPPV